MSPATASMALNGRPNVNRETRRRVEAAAARLRYGGVRRAPGRRLGIWMPPRQGDPFQAMLLRGVSLASAAAGFQLVYIATVLGPHREPVPVPDPSDLDVEGVIVPGGPTLAHLARLADFAGRIVLVDAHSQFPQCPSVDNDDAGGAALAVGHLLSLGHREVGYIGRVRAHNELTWRGYRQAMAGAGLAIRPEWVVDGARTVHDGYQAAAAMLAGAAGRPGALFCASDVIAFGAIHALQEHRLRVPEDVAVVAMDDIDLSAHLNPPLTTVRIPIEEMGATAVRMLLGLLDGSWDGPTHVLPPNELVVRESCGARRAGYGGLAGLQGVEAGHDGQQGNGGRQGNPGRRGETRW